MRRYAVRDDEWDGIKEVLPGKEGDVAWYSQGQSPLCGGCFISLSWGNSVARSAGGLWRVQSDAHALEPKRCGEEGFEALANDGDNEYAMMDRTMVPAPQHSAGAKQKTKTKPLAEAREG